MLLARGGNTRMRPVASLSLFRLATDRCVDGWKANVVVYTHHTSSPMAFVFFHRDGSGSLSSLALASTVPLHSGRHCWLGRNGLPPLVPIARSKGSLQKNTQAQLVHCAFFTQHHHNHHWAKGNRKWGRKIYTPLAVHSSRYVSTKHLATGVYIDHVSRCICVAACVQYVYVCANCQKWSKRNEAALS